MAVAVALALLVFAGAARAKPDSDEARYLSPREMVLSPDGRRLYVMCEASDEVRVVDTQFRQRGEDRRRWARAAGHCAVAGRTADYSWPTRGTTRCR